MFVNILLTIVAALLGYWILGPVAAVGAVVFIGLFAVADTRRQRRRATAQATQPAPLDY